MSRGGKKVQKKTMLRRKSRQRGGKGGQPNWRKEAMAEAESRRGMVKGEEEKVKNDALEKK